MIKLDPPVDTALDTFSICISRVANVGLRARLTAIAPAVEAASNEYMVAAEGPGLQSIAPQLQIGDVTRQEMEKVYTQRMAKKGAPGRDIYDTLLALPPQGRCPLCCQRTVTTLDHHLPKAHFPALAVAPLNLVGACKDCNKAKLDHVASSAAEISIHPYFDDVDGETWLTAHVIEAAPAALQFHVDAPAAWPTVLAERLRNHFSMLGLGPLYATEAAEELLNIRYQLEALFVSAGADQVRAQLGDRAASCRLARRNGWRTASYTAWAESDWFCQGGFGMTG